MTGSPYNLRHFLCFSTSSSAHTWPVVASCFTSNTIYSVPSALTGGHRSPSDLPSIAPCPWDMSRRRILQRNWGYGVLFGLSSLQQQSSARSQVG
jgi:hypothetical protein